MWSCTTTINNVISPKTTVDTTGTMTDIDGNVYATVKIGNQTWMTENLKTTKFNDGTAISYITDMSNWNVLGSGFSPNTIPEYCWYNNKSSNKPLYGALYNWPAVLSGKLGPIGWHVPSEQEWGTALKSDPSMANMAHPGGWLNGDNNGSYAFESVDTTNICWCSDGFTNVYGENFSSYIMMDGLIYAAENLVFNGCSVRLVKD
jgi:uncharacterized protein (TIGR02145 family)